jgi:hypothetical protein
MPRGRALLWFDGAFARGQRRLNLSPYQGLLQYKQRAAELLALLVHPFTQTLCKEPV